MSESSATAESRFLNLRIDSFVGLSLPECACIVRMLIAVERFDPALVTETNSHMSSDERRTANINELFDNHPFLASTSTEPGVNNDGSDLEYRMRVWKAAHDRVDSSFSEDERDFVDDYMRFRNDLSLGMYDFLPKQRGPTDKERHSLLLEAFNRLSDWMETYLNVVKLSPYQCLEKKTLRQWIESSRGKLLLQLGYRPGLKTARRIRRRRLADAQITQAQAQ